MLIKAVRGDGDTYVDYDDADAKIEGPTDQYGIALPSILGMRGLTLAFLAFWSFGSLIAFSLAGERLPWLLMQPALPFTLLTAAGLGLLITRMDWRAVWRGGGALLGIAVLLFIFAAVASSSTSRPPLPAQVEKAASRLVCRVSCFSSLSRAYSREIGWLSYKLLPSRAVQVIAVTFSIVLFAYGLRSMVDLDYRHGDVPVEMMVYTQSAPDTVQVADLIKRLSRDETSFDAGRTAADVTGGRSLQIGVELRRWSGRSTGISATCGR